MLLADSGHSQAEICQTLNCSNETARYWIYTARIGQAHNWHELSIGRPKRVNEEYLNRLEELVNQSPRDCGYPFTRWTAKWLGKHLAKELNIEIGERHINRLLKRWDYLLVRTLWRQINNSRAIAECSQREIALEL
ncbi:MAG: helix-turn-helix domain-containing protein [Pleurocapsa sp. CRU_1_2]|nr:helix-turn-helix domain-containing protein [Pleurocapsa sp. CRU_1_2]